MSFQRSFPKYLIVKEVRKPGKNAFELLIYLANELTLK